MLEEKNFEDMLYLVSLPEDFDPGKQYALVIYLHGAGTRSNSTQALRQGGSLQNLCRRQTDRGYIVAAPLCSAKNWNEVMATLIRLVDSLRSFPYVDSTRVHLTGCSMGGYGTWELASLRPDWFASVMPVCGGGIKWIADALVDMPIRAFHGLRDTVVDPIESLEMVKAVNRRGGQAELILFPTLAHDCWSAVFSTEENYDWLLRFTNDRRRTAVETLTGAQYG